MSDRLILDATAAEHSGEYQHENELWQQRSYQVVVSHIVNLVQEANKLTEQYENAVNKTLPRIHDSIFVSGGRGTGKSVFLNNIARYWQNHSKNLEQKVAFLDTIDPTLLIGNDNFVNVVIAHIHKYMQAQMQRGGKLDQQAQSYHNHLNDLAESLGQSEYNQRDSSGLDRIIHYQSALDLEKHFQEYVYICCQMLGVHGIVILIDDVDMALNKAFDVLETIRRLLSSPLLIPIVCGDEKIYRELLLDYFLYAGDSKRKILAEGTTNLHLAKQYWRKVFPNQLKIGLLPTQFLLGNIVINGQYCHEVTSKQFFNWMDGFVTPLVNGYDDSHCFPKPDTARKLVQTAKQFFRYFDQPAAKAVELQFEQLAFKQNIQRNIIWHEIEAYASSIGFDYGTIMAHTEVILAEVKLDLVSSIEISQLPLFNLSAQHELLTNLQILDVKYYFDIFNTQLNQYFSNEKDSDYVKAQSSVVQKLSKQQIKVLSLLPPLEFYSDQLMVSQSQVKEIVDSANATTGLNNPQLLINLFTYFAPYGLGDKNSHQLYFSRAFEIILQTLLVEYSSKAALKNWLINLIAKPPFYSLLAYSQDFDQEDNYKTNEEGEEALEDAPQLNDEDSSYLDVLVEDIFNWQSADLDSDAACLPQARVLGISHLSHCVMNRVFNQIYQLKKQGVFSKLNELANGDKVEETLIYAIKRFEIIVKNAFGYYLIPETQPLNQLVAKTKKIKVLMTESYENNDPSYRTNVKRFREANFNELNAIFNQTLFKKILSHPLLNLLNDFDNEQPLEILAFGGKSSSKKNQINEAEKIATLKQQLAEAKQDQQTIEQRLRLNQRKLKSTKTTESQNVTDNYDYLLNRVKNEFKNFLNNQRKGTIEQIFDSMSKDVSLDKLKSIRAEIENGFSDLESNKQVTKTLKENHTTKLKWLEEIEQNLKGRD